MMRRDYTKHSAKFGGKLLGMNPQAARKNPMRSKAFKRAHQTHREGSEIVCSCGMRWPLGQEHPDTRDSGSGPKGENSRSEVEGEAPQSGGEAASPQGGHSD